LATRRFWRRGARSGLGGVGWGTGFAARQGSDSYLASESVKGEASAEEAGQASEGMEKMGQVNREKGERLSLSEG